jgi:CcmD family protein
VSNTGWLIVAMLIVAVTIGAYVYSLFARTKSLEARLRRLRDDGH